MEIVKTPENVDLSSVNTIPKDAEKALDKGGIKNVAFLIVVGKNGSMQILRSNVKSSTKPPLRKKKHPAHGNALAVDDAHKDCEWMPEHAEGGVWFPGCWEC